MRTAKMIGLLMLTLLCGLALVSAATALPVNITRVEIDDHKIQPNQTNRLDVMRGNQVAIEVFLDASQDVDDVEVEVLVSGFEHNKDLRLADHVGPFDMDANVTYRKTVHITFPDLVEEDNYKVRVIVTDRNSQEVIENYHIKIDLDRHDLKIVDAIFTPSRRVMAGQALLGVVRIENFGEKDEKDVKVTVAIPELSLSATDYLNEIESDDEKQTEELYLPLAKCTKPGVYDLVMTVEYNDGFSKTGAKGKVEVIENPACEPEDKVEVQLPPAEASPKDTVKPVPHATSKVRLALEVILLVLVALLVLIGLVIGFTKMGKDEE